MAGESGEALRPSIICMTFRPSSAKQNTVTLIALSSVLFPYTLGCPCPCHSQARLAAVASYTAPPEFDTPGSSMPSSPCRPSSSLSRRSSTRSVGFTSRNAPSKATAGNYPVGSSQGRMRTLRSLASRYTSIDVQNHQFDSASEDQSDTEGVHLEV